MALETGIEGLEDFRPVFDETYARHGTRPTHTIEEIATLLSRYPDRPRPCQRRRVRPRTRPVVLAK